MSGRIYRLLKSEFVLVAVFGGGLRGFLEGVVQGGEGGGALDGFAFHEFFDGAELEAWVLLLVGLVLVEAGADGFCNHVTGGRLEGDEDPHSRLLAVQHAAQVTNVFDAGFAAFDLDDDLLGLGLTGVVAEEDFAVYAAVSAFLLFDRAGADQAEGPPLELEFVLLGQGVGLVGRDRFADGDDFDFVAVSVAEPVLDEGGGKLGDVDANPFTAMFLGCINCRSAAAKGVEHEVARVAAGLDDALKQGDGLLGWVA